MDDDDESPTEPDLGDDEEDDEHVPEDSPDEEDEFNENDIMVEDGHDARPRGQLIVELKVDRSSLSKLKAATQGNLTPSPDNKDAEQNGERKPSEGTGQSPSKTVESVPNGQAADA